MAGTRSMVNGEQVASDAGWQPLAVRVRPILDLTDEQLLTLSHLNRDLRLERDTRGDLVIMPPTGGETGEQNAEISMQLRVWAKRDGMGTTFDSSGGFRLSNGAIRSPDASWVAHSRLAALTPEQRQGFIPLCPDFVIELRSPTDSLVAVQDKMAEYIAEGAQLGWLLDAPVKRVYVYRPDTPVERLDDPETVAGDPVLPGFVLDLREVW